MVQLVILVGFNMFPSTLSWCTYMYVIDSYNTDVRFVLSRILIIKSVESKLISYEH